VTKKEHDNDGREIVAFTNNTSHDYIKYKGRLVAFS
jgi:hypothetical protein